MCIPRRNVTDGVGAGCKLFVFQEANRSKLPDNVYISMPNISLGKAQNSQPVGSLLNFFRKVSDKSCKQLWWWLNITIRVSVGVSIPSVS